MRRLSCLVRRFCRDREAATARSGREEVVDGHRPPPFTRILLRTLPLSLTLSPLRGARGSDLAEEVAGDFGDAFGVELEVLVQALGRARFK